MRKLKTSDITTSVGLPVKGGTLEHIQLAYQEALREAVKGLIGATYDPAKMYVLSGLVNTGVGTLYDITAGSIFYNGEVYLVDAVKGTLPGTNAVVANIVVQYFTGISADPVEFTDGQERNIHEIRKIILQPGFPGSGESGANGNYNSFVRIFSNITPVKIIAGNAGIEVEDDYPTVKISSTVVPQVIRQGRFRIADIRHEAGKDPNATILAGGNDENCAYVYNFPDPLPTDQVYIFLQVSNPDYNTFNQFNKNYGCFYQIGKVTATQMFFHVSAVNVGTNVQDLYVQWMAVKM